MFFWSSGIFHKYREIIRAACEDGGYRSILKKQFMSIYKQEKIFKEIYKNALTNL